MKVTFIGCLLFLMLIVDSIYAQEQPVSITLDDIILQAKKQSTTAKIAESIKENRYFQFLSYNARLRPQLALSGNVLSYSKDYFGVVQPDGNLIFQPRTQNYSSMGLSLSQQIGITGGTIAVNSNLTRFDDLDRNDKRYSGIPINISLSQPLLSFNSYKWDKKIEPLRYQEAEKEYIQDTENISLQSTKLYFNVLDAQADLELAKKNIESQKTMLSIENKRVALGTTSKEKILQIRLQLLKSTQELGASEVNLKTAIFKLNSYIGLSNSPTLALKLPIALPIVQVTIDEAIAAAKKNRAEFVAFKRRKLEAEKELDAAKKERFKLDLFTAFGYNNIGPSFSTIYRDAHSQQSLTLGIHIPILDWGRTKGKISIATSNLKTIAFTIEQEELVLIEEITYLVENLKYISANINIAEQADNIAQERYDLAIDQFRFGKISVTELNIALGEKDNAKRSFITALRKFWESYYQIKALTLMEI